MKWRTYFQSNGGSAYLHIKDNGTEAEDIIVNIFNDIINNKEYGIESWYSREILDNIHVYKTIKYMLEAKRGYSFDESLTDIIIENLEVKNIKYSTHGYRENKENYKCNLIISGEYY